MNYEFDVSLVITTYNEEKYFPILLQSIKNQKTSLKMEIIIVDDASTDSTLEIVHSNIEANKKEEHPMPYMRYKLIHNDRKSDVQYMRNLGLENASGQTILFCDADVALSKNYIERMVKPIIDGYVDTMLCKTYAILEGFYNIRPNQYSKTYDFYLKHAPRFFLKRFPVQLFPWLLTWFKNMKKHKKYLSIWTTENRSHTTGITTKTNSAKKFGGWNAKIGDGDDARYSYDVFDNSDRVLFDRKSILYETRRRVIPKNSSWMLPAILRKKHRDNYSKSIR